MKPVRSKSDGGSLLLDAWFPFRLTERWIAAQVGDAGLSADEIAFCSLLGEDRTAGQLSDLLGIPPTTLSGMAGRLERRGLVARTVLRTDARARVWRLTSEGAALRSEIEGRFADAYRRLAARLPRPASAIAEHLFALEWALREDLGVAQRAGQDAPAVATVELDGDSLTPAEEVELRRFAQWLRARRSMP